MYWCSIHVTGADGSFNLLEYADPDLDLTLTEDHDKNMFDEHLGLSKGEAETQNSVAQSAPSQASAVVRSDISQPASAVHSDTSKDPAPQTLTGGSMSTKQVTPRLTASSATAADVSKGVTAPTVTVVASKTTTKPCATLTPPGVTTPEATSTTATFKQPPQVAISTLTLNDSMTTKQEPVISGKPAGMKPQKVASTRSDSAATSATQAAAMAASNGATANTSPPRTKSPKPKRKKSKPPALPTTAKSESSEKPATGLCAEALKTPTSATDFQAKFLEFSKKQTSDLPEKEMGKPERKSQLSSAAATVKEDSAAGTAAVKSEDSGKGTESATKDSGGGKVTPEVKSDNEEKKETLSLPLQVDGCVDDLDSDDSIFVCHSLLPLQVDVADDREITGSGQRESGSR